ncbi:MAG: RrF2 family transcriptional regulator [Sphaerochaetaceae bacterium]|jgi:Rrf2 family iron-sulfur cluster assembly transcriptional regulator
MFISTRGRYAIRIMIDLAEQNSSDFIPLKDIAERQDISEKYLESIINQLVKGRLVTGRRGKGGGYKLLKNCQDYTIYDILVLTETSLAPVACLDDNGEGCRRATTCKTFPFWKELDQTITQFLSHRTLADLLEEHTGGNYCI